MSLCVLHTVSASPHGNTFKDCMRVIQQGDALVLLGDAVYAAAHNATALHPLFERGVPIYALQCDCEARGVTLNDPLLPINMTRLVILTEEYPRQLAWY